MECSGNVAVRLVDQNTDHPGWYEGFIIFSMLSTSVWSKIESWIGARGLLVQWSRVVTFGTLAYLVLACKAINWAGL